jgi:hypothetical protein
MTRAFMFQLEVLKRRKVFVITALATVVFCVGSAALIVLNATASNNGDGRGATVAGLSQAGGGTEVFTRGVSFAGTFLFVLFVGAFATDFGRGTVRTMLLRQPKRLSLLGGRLAAVLAFAAAWLAAAEVVTWIAARAMAPSNGITTGDWTSVSALGAAIGDYGTVLIWVSGYAILALAVSVVARSVALALGLAIAWSGPIEHIIQNDWPAAVRWFPGLSLEAFVAGGTTEVTAAHAFAVIAVYVTVAAVVAITMFTRRDVTA